MTREQMIRQLELEGYTITAPMPTGVRPLSDLKWGHYAIFVFTSGYTDTPFGAVVGYLNASLNPVSYTRMALHNVIGWMPVPWL